MWYTVSKSTAFINLQIYRNLWLLRSINGMAVLNFKTISCSDKPTNNKPPDSAAVFSAAEHLTGHSVYFSCSRQLFPKHVISPASNSRQSKFCLVNISADLVSLDFCA